MTKGPKISIITACYNAEKTIEQTIQSVINQTYENIEYIIIDGASTDGTTEVINRYRDKINVIISEPDKGVYDAFNKGAIKATGDYIQYLNADDYLLDNAVISKIAGFIEEKNNPVLIYGGIIIKDEFTGYIYPVNKSISFENIQNGQMIPHPATFVQKVKLLEMNLFNCTYKIAADFDLISKLYKKYKNDIHHLSLFISGFRMGGISNNVKNLRILECEMERIIETNFSNIEYQKKELGNDIYLKKWLEAKLFSEKNLGQVLLSKGVESVAIFGSGQVSNMLAKDLQKSSISIQVFIDNDEQKQQLEMNGIQIVSPNWLLENKANIDAIVFGFEGFHDDVVIKQLSAYGLLPGIPCLNWRDLVSEL